MPSTFAQYRVDRPTLTPSDVLSTGVVTFAAVALASTVAAFLTGIAALGVQTVVFAFAATVCFAFAGAIVDEPGPDVTV